METTIIALDAIGLDERAEALSRLLSLCVADGAAIGFMAPLSVQDAAQFWSQQVRPELVAGRRMAFVAEHGGEVLGAVQLVTAMPANQSHRCEIAKMIVHPRARRRGIGRALMNHALDHACALGKTLVTLDTRTGDVAEPLYASVGFEVAGTIPGYAWDADGKARHATTYMFRHLAPLP